MIVKKSDIALEVELERATKCFYEAAEKNSQLPILLLVDPIRAMEDAGAKLSQRARRYIRRTYTGRAYGNTELYEAVRSGEIKVPWLRAVHLRKGQQPKQEGTSNDTEERLKHA